MILLGIIVGTVGVVMDMDMGSRSVGLGGKASSSKLVDVGWEDVEVVAEHVNWGLLRFGGFAHVYKGLYN